VEIKNQEAESANESEAANTATFDELNNLASNLNSAVDSGSFSSAVGAPVVGSVEIENTAPVTQTILNQRKAAAAAKLLREQQVQATIV